MFKNIPPMLPLRKDPNISDKKNGSMIKSVYRKGSSLLTNGGEYNAVLNKSCPARIKSKIHLRTKNNITQLMYIDIFLVIKFASSGLTEFVRVQLLSTGE